MSDTLHVPDDFERTSTADTLQTTTEPFCVLFIEDDDVCVFMEHPDRVVEAETASRRMLRAHIEAIATRFGATRSDVADAAVERTKRRPEDW
jgi:hypothetical protein